MEQIEKLLRESLKDIKNLYENNSIKSKILFPKYSDNKNRYSEQELKCVFLTKIESSDFYYSVETPSNYKYRFVDEDPKVLFTDEESSDKYQSSMIDLSLYDNHKKLISHIEFKHGQCPIFPIQKDFLKLICESDKINNNYFVHYLDKSDKKTKKAILEKYKDSVKNIISVNKNVIKIKEKFKKVHVFVLFAGLESGDNLFCFSLQTLMNTEIDKIPGEHI